MGDTADIGVPRNLCPLELPTPSDLRLPVMKSNTNWRIAKPEGNWSKLKSRYNIKKIAI